MPADSFQDRLLILQDGDVLQHFILRVCGARFRYACEEAGRHLELRRQKPCCGEAVAGVVAVAAEEQDLLDTHFDGDPDKMLRESLSGILHHLIVGHTRLVGGVFELHHFKR